MTRPFGKQSTGWGLGLALFLMSAGIMAWADTRPLMTTVSLEGLSVKGAATSDMIERGRAYYENSCGQCHGDEAQGNEGPSLHNLTISNARIATTIDKGLEKKMPAFAKKYNGDQIAALVAYLRTLR